MLSLKRAGEEGSATPPSDPSCPVPNTRGLPHLQGGETIAGFEDPSSRAIIPLLGQRPAVAHLPSGAERSKVCKSLHPTAKEAVSRKRPHESSCQWDQALCLACVATTRWSGVGHTLPIPYALGTSAVPCWSRHSVYFRLVPLRDLPNPPSAYGDPTPVEANGSTFWTLLHPRRIRHFGLTPSHCQSPGTQMNVAPALATWPSPGNGRW